MEKKGYEFCRYGIFVPTSGIYFSRHSVASFCFAACILGRYPMSRIFLDIATTVSCDPDHVVIPAIPCSRAIAYNDRCAVHVVSQCSHLAHDGWKIRQLYPRIFTETNWSTVYWGLIMGRHEAPAVESERKVQERKRGREGGKRLQGRLRVTTCTFGTCDSNTYLGSP